MRSRRPSAVAAHAHGPSTRDVDDVAVSPVDRLQLAGVRAGSRARSPRAVGDPRLAIVDGEGAPPPLLALPRRAHPLRLQHLGATVDVEAAEHEVVVDDVQHPHAVAVDLHRHRPPVERLRRGGALAVRASRWAPTSLSTHVDRSSAATATTSGRRLGGLVERAPVGQAEGAPARAPSPSPPTTHRRSGPTARPSAGTATASPSRPQERGRPPRRLPRDGEHAGARRRRGAAGTAAGGRGRRAGRRGRGVAAAADPPQRRGPPVPAAPRRPHGVGLAVGGDERQGGHRLAHGPLRRLELLAEGEGRRRAVARALGQAPLEHAAHGTGHPAGAQVRRRLAGDAVVERRHRLVLVEERRAAPHDGQEGGGQGVDVGRRPGPLAGQHLRGDVGHAGPDDGGARDEAAGDAGDAEVAEERLAVVREEDVLRLHVAVHHAPPVRGLEARRPA